MSQNQNLTQSAPPGLQVVKIMGVWDGVAGVARATPNLKTPSCTLLRRAVNEGRDEGKKERKEEKS